MKLQRLAESIGAQTEYCPDIDIDELFMDSRQEVSNGRFFCVSGANVDGHRFAAQAVMGSAALLLHSGRHPAELKDMVCSPAGTTIEMVHALENGAFRGTVMEAMNACRMRSADMRS